MAPSPNYPFPLISLYTPGTAVTCSTVTAQSSGCLLGEGPSDAEPAGDLFGELLVTIQEKGFDSVEASESACGPSDRHIIFSSVSLHQVLAQTPPIP